MPRSQKPIVCICGSNKIDYIDLDRFINPSSVGQIISEELYAKDWAYAHNIEYLSFKPNYRVFKDTALLERDKDMIKHCDVVIIF